jgi:hydroxyacylglutathione hydrolase
MTLQIIQIPILQDNYVYVLHEATRGEGGRRQAVVIDPGEGAPVLDVLAQHDLELTWILNTHHHGDHTGGNLMLQQNTSCRIAGPAREAGRIPGITHLLAEDDDFNILSRKISVLDVSGHTAGHIAYVFMQDMRVFCGDALFAMGCGRLFEGTPEQAWCSLQKLRALPEDTQVYCTHEYSAVNSRFALTIMPDNKSLQERAKQVVLCRAAGLPTVPFRLEDDRATNPFLRADDPAVAQAMSLSGATPAQVFAALRLRRDAFQG